MPIWKWLSPLAAAALLSACANLPQRDDQRVRRLLGERGTVVGFPIGAAEQDESRRIAALRLAQPLRVDDAVAVALLRSASLQAELARLGLSHAELIEASRPGNPTLGLLAQHSSESGTRVKLGLSLTQSLADLLLLQSRRRLAQGELDATQEAAARAVQRFIAEVATDYFELIGAQHVAQMRGVIANAATVSAALAQRFADAGNIAQLDLRRQQAEAVAAQLAAEAATAEVARARLALNAHMGLGPDEADWQVLESLPLPVPVEDQLDAVLTRAMQARLDLAAARRRAERLAEALGVTRRFRWLGEFEVGIDAERETDGEKLIGPSVALQLPVFHRNQAALARAQAQLDRAEMQALALETDIGNAVAAAHAALLAARIRAERHRNELVPLREQVVERLQERVNFMLAGQFELLLAKGLEYDAYQGYLESLRDYWVARIALADAIGAALPSDARIPDEGARAIELPAVAPPMQHGGHDAHVQPSMPGHESHDMHAPHRTAPPPAKPQQPASDPHAGHARPARPDAPSRRNDEHDHSQHRHEDQP